MLLFFKRLFSILKKLIKAKYYLSLPPRKEIVIFDINGSEFIKEILPKNKYYILSSRYEHLNLIILFQCLFSLNISYRHYLKKYIEYINPKILITWIDNNPFFYEIKLNSGIKIFIQNGRRTEMDIFYKLDRIGALKKNYHVDYMFVHNDIIGKKYLNYVKGKTFSLGSFRSNNIQIKKSKKIYDLMYISTFRDTYLNPPKKIDIFNFGNWVKNEIIFLEWLHRYCKANDRHLTVLGASLVNKEKAIKEKNFFKKIFNDINWKFIERTRKRNTYRIIDKAFMLLGVDSTLAYEAFGRRLRVGFFGIRGSEYQLGSRKFGWPDKFKNKGPFWTNHLLEKEFERVIVNLTNYSSEQWQKILGKYQERVHSYNFSNALLRKLIKKNLKITEQVKK